MPTEPTPKKSGVQVVAHILALLVSWFIWQKIGGFRGLIVAVLLAGLIEFVFLVFLVVLGGLAAPFADAPLTKEEQAALAAEEARAIAAAKAEEARVDRRKLRAFRTAGFITLAVAIPWIVFVFWKYRTGPYVSVGTALFDSIPIVALFCAVGLLVARPYLRHVKTDRDRDAPCGAPLPHH